MPEINLFNQGINRYKHPRKLDNNEFKSVINGDVSSGSLRSVNNPVLVGTGVSQRFVEYKDRVVSGHGAYLTFEQSQQYLFKSDGVLPLYTVGKRDSNDILEWIPMGIETTPADVVATPLTATMTVSLTTDEGTSEVADYTYMVKVNDTDIYQVTYSCPTSGVQVIVRPNTFSIPWSTIEVYRKYKGNYYLLSTGADTRDFVIDADLINIPEYDGACTYVWAFNGIYGNPYPEGFYTGVQAIADGRGNCRIFHVNSSVGPFTYADRLVDEYAFAVNFLTGVSPSTSDNFRYLRYPEQNEYYGQVVQLLGKEQVNGLWEFKFIVLYDFDHRDIFRAFTIKVTYNSIEVVEVSPFAEPAFINWLPPVPDLLVREPLTRTFTAPTTAGEIIDGSSATLDLDNRMDASLVGTFQYAITYEDNLGAETAVASYSNIVDSDGSSLSVSIGTPSGIDPALTQLNLYRLNSDRYSGQTSFLLVKTFDISALPTTFVDSTEIADLGKLLPPATLTTVNQDLLYFTSYKGRLFGATKDYDYVDIAYAPSVGDEYPAAPYAYGRVWKSSNSYTYTTGDLAGQTIAKEGLIIYRAGRWELLDGNINEYDEYYTLRWSDIGKPLTWQVNSWLNMDKYITGIGTTANGIIIFSRTSTYALLGTESESFTLRLLSSSHGCVDHRSIQHWKGNCIYAGVDGITMTDGGNVDLISYPKLGIVPMDQVDRPTDVIWYTNVKSSAVVGNTYFLLLKSGTMIKFDLDTLIVTEIVHHPRLFGVGQVSGKLYGVNEATDLFDISYRSEYTGVNPKNFWYSIVTGLKTEGRLTDYKEYDKVRVSIAGSGNISIRIDKKYVIRNRVLDDGVTLIGIPNEHNKGYGIEFTVSGKGSLHSIEYTLKGQENG